ncbi:MAG: thiamine phosphate synthase [Caulobacterales bacterium]
MGANFSRLLRGATRLNAQRRDRRLPPLLFVTDPARISDPLGLLRQLPRSADGRLGVIFRHFGAPDRLATARSLVKLCRKRRFILLIGADPALAVKVRADGVHLPERMAARAAGLKTRRPRWIVTGAAHTLKTLRHARGSDAILASPVFETQSAGAKGRKLLGPRGLSRFAHQATAPIYALGGVNDRTIQKIQGVRGVLGAAVASGLSPLEHNK